MSLELYKNNALIGIIHFDDQYKVIKDKYYNTDDIDEMHIYKDAIIATVGVLSMSINSKSEINELNQIFNIIDKFIRLSSNDNAYGI
ncbi:hypothetical protein [Romboutsia timonensis]|uniref:hypothetical protein n=1 Tax=Romboutsia timonensis TaxID=1776391 RepID=UPI003FA6AFE0